MFGVDSSELLVCLLIAVVVIGPKDLPGVLRTVGHWVGKARGMANQFRSGLDQMVRETELADLEKKWREQNEEIMRAFPTVDSAPGAAWDGGKPIEGEDKAGPDLGKPALGKPSLDKSRPDLPVPDPAVDWGDTDWGSADPVPPVTGTPRIQGSGPRPPVTGKAPVATRSRIESGRESAARPSLGGPTSFGDPALPEQKQLELPTGPAAPPSPPLTKAPPPRRTVSRRAPRSGAGSAGRGPGAS